MTVTLTEGIVLNRELVTRFADYMEPPVDIRQCLLSAVRDDVPVEVTPEAIGWTLAAVSGVMLRLAGMALDRGESPAGVVIAPRMLAALCSAAEGFITEAELASLDS